MVNQELNTLKREIITDLKLSGVAALVINLVFFCGLMIDNDSMQWSAVLFSLPIVYFLYAKLLPKIKNYEEFNEVEDNG